MIRKSCEASRPEHFTDRNHCCECADHDDLLRSRNIDSLTIDDLGNPGWDPICFVTDKAFFYYFPARTSDILFIGFVERLTEDFEP